MSHKFKTILTVLAVLWMALSAQAKVSVTAKLDSVQMMLGSLNTLRLEVVQDKGKPGGFPMFKNADPSLGYVGICGDSIELRTSFKVDTVELGSGKVQLNYAVPIQSFDSASYRLPQFVYVSEGDSARSNALTLNVVPMKLTADDPIAGFAPVAEPEGKKFFDFVPDWIADFWWVIIIVLLAIAAFIWAMRRYRKEGTVLPKKPEPSPYETAIRDLQALKKEGLWEKGQEKEYFTRLTDILRIYLERRFGINAMEMTSREIMDRLYDSDVRDKRNYVRQILSVADFVKFAKVRPLPADNIEAYNNAVKFVEETKPEPPAPADGKDQPKSSDINAADAAKASSAQGATEKKGGES